ncbi:hypothetical protein DSL72_001286 [Monilinia vaccinii-corymbosi]|uniref:Uncharacterized protein n=1 Tax=Monilinia vaccinii-corymbosi TaxID=61207 RepID=A0A8A3PA10_9HELO|nr:hypothetical protein DSL72_001286 [Monilinia vaccinii-corymbosi]
MAPTSLIAMRPRHKNSTAKNLHPSEFAGHWEWTIYCAVLQLIRRKHIRTANPTNIQAMLAPQFSDFSLGPTRRGALSPRLGTGVFTADGEQWKCIYTSSIHKGQGQDLDLEETHVRNMMSILEPLIGATGSIEEIDLLPYFFRSLPGLQSTAIGGSVSKFVTAFDIGQRVLATRTRFMDCYWIYDSQEFCDACRVVHEFADHFVRLALSKDLRQAAFEKGGKNKEQYISLGALTAYTQDVVQLRYELLHYSSTLPAIPARYKKLRDAIIADFGIYDHPTEISFSKLKGCKYLRYSNYESLCIYPVVPINARQATKDTTLPRGGGKDGQSPIFIPKGSTWDYSVHS